MSIHISGTIMPEVDVSYHEHDIEVSIDDVSDLIELADESGISQDEIFEYIVDGELIAHLNPDLVMSWIEDHAPANCLGKIARVAVAQAVNMYEASEQRNAELRETVAKQSERIGELTTNNLSS